MRATACRECACSLKLSLLIYILYMYSICFHRFCVLLLGFRLFHSLSLHLRFFARFIYAVVSSWLFAAAAADTVAVGALHFCRSKYMYKLLRLLAHNTIVHCFAFEIMRPKDLSERNKRPQ